MDGDLTWGCAHTHNTIYRTRMPDEGLQVVYFGVTILYLYTWNLYDSTHQGHPNKFNKIAKKKSSRPAVPKQE